MNLEFRPNARLGAFPVPSGGARRGTDSFTTPSTTPDVRELDEAGFMFGAEQQSTAAPFPVFAAFTGFTRDLLSKSTQKTENREKRYRIKDQRLNTV